MWHRATSTWNSIPESIRPILVTLVVAAVGWGVGKVLDHLGPKLPTPLRRVTVVPRRYFSTCRRHVGDPVLGAVVVTALAIELALTDQESWAVILLVTAVLIAAFSSTVSRHRSQNLQQIQMVEANELADLRGQLAKLTEDLRKSTEDVRTLTLVRDRLEPLAQLHDRLATATVPFLSPNDPGFDLEQAIAHVIETFMYHSVRVIAPHGGGVGISVLTPEGTGQYLVIWKHHDLPPATLKARFYIGPDHRQRKDKGGMASVTFLSGDAEFTTVREQRSPKGGLTFRANNGRFMFLAGNRIDPGFRALATVPVVDGNLRSRAVLCVHSSNLQAFAANETREVILPTLARAIAIPILLHDQLRRGVVDVQPS